MDYRRAVRTCSCTMCVSCLALGLGAAADARAADCHRCHRGEIGPNFDLASGTVAAPLTAELGHHPVTAGAGAADQSALRYVRSSAPDSQYAISAGAPSFRFRVRAVRVQQVHGVPWRAPST